MNEETALWKAFKQHNSLEKEKRRQRIVQKILNLRKKGYRVVELTPYQFRINNQLDIYPVNGKYHNIKTGERGHIPYEILL